MAVRSSDRDGLTCYDGRLRQFGPIPVELLASGRVCRNDRRLTRPLWSIHAVGAPLKSQQETDQQLVERVKRGDKRAFDLLVVKYQHKIVGLVSRYVRDQDEVVDVTQEAFIKAYRALPRFRGDSAFYTWLYRIAINTAKNYLVSRSRRPPVTDIDIEEGEFHDNSAVLRDIENPENSLATDQLEAVVYKAIEDLPEELKVAVTLREFEGLSYEEIAEVMECPVGTVRSRIFRAREAIEKKIEAIG